MTSINYLEPPTNSPEIIVDNFPPLPSNEKELDYLKPDLSDFSEIKNDKTSFIDRHFKSIIALIIGLVISATSYNLTVALQSYLDFQAKVIQTQTQPLLELAKRSGV